MNISLICIKRGEKIMKYEHLFSTVKIGQLELKNRFVVPPMSTNYANSDGTVSEQMLAYYIARAKGGFGLIFVEATAVTPRGKGLINELALWDDNYINGMKKLADAVHKEGSKIFVQLHHAGRQTDSSNIEGMQPVAPSPVPCPLMDIIPHELTVAEIWDVVHEFGDAALRVKKAGFDGVEIHGAHGYLVSQFMSTHANKRTDEFGGTFEGRMKFLQEIVKDIKKKCGYDFPITLRMGYDEKVNGGRTLEESVVVARFAESIGIDALHISIMTYASLPYMSAPPAMASGFNQFPTGVIKEAVSIPVITVGRYNNMLMADEVIRLGRADLVAMGRESLADPELPKKVEEGKLDEISPCIGCVQSCLGYLLNPEVNKISCLVRPLTGHEFEYDLSKAETKKNVIVVGAGPAGLMASWVAAKRGHKVTLVEKSNNFGGQFRAASIPPTKHEIAAAIKYYVTMGKKYGVNYKLETNVDEAYIQNMKPDVIILATGGEPLRPKIKGINNEKFTTVQEVLEGHISPGFNVLIVGGGQSGSETADFLGEHNRNVTMIEMRKDIAMDEEATPAYFLKKRLKEHDITAVTNAKVLELFDDGVVYEQDEKQFELRGFDTVVLAMGVQSYNPLEEIARKYIDEVYVIGDAQKPGPANHATVAGLKVALEI